MEVHVNKPKVCGTCGALDAPLKCPCKAAFYCNAECQAGSWREHREVCTHHLERKLERQRGRVGLDDVSIGDACLKLGTLFYNQDRCDDAAEQYEEALRIFTLVEGGREVERWGELSANMGNLYLKQGRVDDALRLYKKVLRVYRRMYGSEHSDLALAGLLNNMGAILGQTGDLDGAMSKFEEAHAIYDRLHDVSANGVFSNMARILKEQGKYAESVAMQQIAVDKHRRATGSDSDEVAKALLNLGAAYCLQGMYEEALVQWEEGLGVIRRVHPERNETEGDFLADIGRVYIKQGRHEEALVMYKKAHRIYRKTLGPSHEKAVNASEVTMELVEVRDMAEQYHEFLAPEEMLAQEEGEEQAGDAEEKIEGLEGDIEALREARLDFIKWGFDSMAARVDAALRRRGAATQ